MAKPISYNTIFSRAVHFVIRQPVIWLLSFIMVFGSNALSEREFVKIFSPTSWHFPVLYFPLVTDFPRFDLLYLFNLVAIADTIGLALLFIVWLGALVAQATLIVTAARLALDQRPQLSTCLAHGVRRVWRVIAVNLLVFGAFYGLILIYAFAFANSPTRQIPASLQQHYWNTQIMQAGGQYSVSQVMLCTALPLNLLALIVYPPFVVAVVLENRSWWQSLRFGWRLVWVNLGRLIGFWVIFGGLSLLTGVLLFEIFKLLGQFPSDSVKAFDIVAIATGMILSILIGAIITVAGVQLYQDCAQRLCSTQEQNINTQATV